MGYNSQNNINLLHKGWFMNVNMYSINHESLTDYSNRLNGYSPFIFLQKRIIDLSISGFLLIISSPIIAYTIYRIKKESPGPIFFTQPRVGLHGKKFTCYKFRSMHTNASFNPYTEEKDPRIFKYGNIMRKMRIDELPQILNILKGDMHLIGPRAEWDILVEKYETIIPNYKQRHSVRPGITGLAQVSYPYGRNIYDAKQKLKYDLIYIKNWSLWLELKVAVKTAGVVFGKKGV